MINLTFLLVLIHLNNQIPSLATVEVTCNKLCNCSIENNNEDEISRGTESTVSCSSGVEMTLTDYGGAKVIIKCQQLDGNLSSVLDGLNVTATRYSQVTLEACSLFNSSISDLLASIGVRDFGKLNIISYNGSLQRKHFKNLDKVFDLKIARSDLGVLPEDIFKGLRNLKNIEIVFSFFQLTKGIFLYTPNLEKVILNRNIVSEVSFDVFNNMRRLDSLEIYATNNTSVIFDESKQYTLPSLSYLLIQSIRLNTQLHVLGSALDESKLSMVENINSALLTLLRDLTLQSTKKQFTLVLHNNTANAFLLQPRCFADLFNLDSIQLTDSNIKIVPEDAFSNSSNIRKVNLNSNLINSFEPNTFSDLKRLETLSIRNNRISYLPEGLFSETKSLKSLKIGHNLLKHIEPHLFFHLSKLFYLDLSHNNIIHISGEQFSQLESLMTIDLSHNQLVSLVLDPLLSDLDFSVFYKCTELESLFLENNSLTEFYEDWGLQLTQLSRLNLANNGITDIQTLNITHDVISFEFAKRKIITDDLHNIYFPENGIKTTKVINIYNNQMNCNCDLLTSLYNVSQYFTKERTLLENMECKKPTLFENVKMIDIWTVEYEKCTKLPPDEIQKFHQGCPKGCRCVYRPFTKSSVINCQNAHLHDYPRALPVAPNADHTELTLYGNSLQEFSLPDDPGYKNVTFLNLAKNSLSTLNINGVSKKLKKLDLSHNKLKTLSVETLDLLEGALELERLELHNNPWTCDVSNYRLARLVRDKQHLTRYNVACADGSPIVKTIELYLTQVELIRRQVMTYVVSGVVVMILMTVFILTVLYYRHRQKVHVYCFSSRWKVLRWLVSHPDYDDSDKLYDAFIIYSQEDEMFVVNHLVPYLEETEDRKYKLCLHFRDWIPGEQILIQIGRSVRSSRRAIVVLSPNFLRSVWGVAEFRVAHAKALKDGTARVIVILYQDVSDDEVDEELKAYLQTNTYVRWGSPWFWKQLTYALPHPPDSERAGLHYFSRG